MYRFAFRFLVTICMALPSQRALAADQGAFLKSYCFACHSGDTKEGGLDLAGLPMDLASPAIFAKWERIHDRVDAGEMPPKSSDQPPPAVRAAFAMSLNQELTAAHAKAKGTALRRLNRREYENTLNDLFGTNLKLAQRLPEDGRAHEFDNVGDALGISMVQMQRYLECTTTVLDEATLQATVPPPSKLVRASYAETRGAEDWLGKVWLKRDDGAVVFFKNLGYPTGMLREANVQQDGWYKIRVTGYAFQSDRPITFAVGATTFARGVEQPTFGYFQFPPGPPTAVELRAWIPARYMVEVTPYGITDRNNEIRKSGVVGYAGPGLAVQAIEVEGPLIDESRGRGARLIFAGLNRREIAPHNPNDRMRPWYVPKFEIVSAAPATDVVPVLMRVASKAWRRPTTIDSVNSYLSLFEDERKRGASIEEALRTAVTAIFCAPDFLYLREPNGPLDDFSLAARLSYFLTRTTPDNELLAVAAAGQLTKDPATMAAQMDRLLKRPHSARFVADFTDAWLNLRDIDFTNPDETLYPEFDPYLQFSMIAETRAFFRKLVEDNLGIRHVVKSDFAMLNERLAEHYGIAGVAGPELQTVVLPPDCVRGGILSQASILKVSANGTNTSPVVRGVWVMERLLGQPPPPPPPGIPGVEPDIRGATTLRELLDKHRSVDSCKTCHQVIDPPGFALESFDPIGGWRDHFRSLGGGQREDVEVRGMRVQYKRGPQVDATGQFADGRTFAGFQEFRDQLAQDEASLAKALTAKLLTFATGREMGFSDRAEIDRIVAASKPSAHGLRDLIRLVVQSETFRRK